MFAQTRANGKTEFILRASRQREVGIIALDESKGIETTTVPGGASDIVAPHHLPACSSRLP
jgi:hypothetical protein